MENYPAYPFPWVGDPENEEPVEPSMAPEKREVAYQAVGENAKDDSCEVAGSSIAKRRIIMTGVGRYPAVSARP